MARSNPPINGNVIYRQRMELGYTQARVRELTGRAGCEINEPHLSKLERGTVQRPGPPARKALREVLELTDAQMFAPCEQGHPWSAACMDHDAPREDSTAQAGPARVAKTGAAA
jgi:transcriptional regulator with XRE-family HTH domain